MPGCHTMHHLHIKHHDPRGSTHTYGAPAPKGGSLIPMWLPRSQAHLHSPSQPLVPWVLPVPPAPEGTAPHGNVLQDFQGHLKVCSNKTFLQGSSMFSNSEPQNLFSKSSFPQMLDTRIGLRVQPRENPEWNPEATSWLHHTCKCPCTSQNVLESTGIGGRCEDFAPQNRVRVPAPTFTN